MILNPVVVAQSAGVVTDISAIANSTNPVVIALTGVTTVLDVCAPPNVKYPVRCFGLLVTLGVAMASPEPFSKVAFLASIRSVLRP